MSDQTQSTERTQNTQTKKPWYKKWWVIGIGALFLYSIVSNSFEEAREKAKEAKDTVSDNQQVTKQANQLEEVIPEPSPIKLSGTSQQASQTFSLENGLSVFKMTHTGTSNFAVVLMDSDGQRVELLVNEIGKFDGAKAVGITKKGEYILDVSADGKWAITIEQPRPVTAESTPKTFTGTGQLVSPFIKLDKGLTTFKLKHAGKSNFAVILMDKSGNREELLVNEIGDFDGSKAVGISRSGIYLLDISADGAWTASVE